MSPRQRTILLAFCVLGLAASLAAAWVHYRMLMDPAYVSFCDVSETVNCQSVYRSAYGSVRGVPISVFGVLWFALVTLLVWFDRRAPQPAPVRGKTPPPAPPSATAGYVFVLSTAALAVVLYLAYASWFILKMVCIYCILTYIAVLGIFIVGGAAFTSGFGTLASRAGSDLRRLLRSPVGVTVSVAYVVCAMAAILLFPREAVVAASGDPQAAAAPQLQIPEEQRAQFEKYMADQPRVPLAIPNDGAAVLVVKFNDYQCPPCRQTYLDYKPIIERFKKSHPGQVKYVTMDFPLEAECNTGGVHAASCEAAAAVRIARLKGRAEAMEDWLFDNQIALTPELVRRGLRDVAQVADFDAQYPRVLEQVRADAAMGRQLGVKSTPTFFVNGVRIEGGLRAPFFEAAINYELQRAQTAKQ